MNRLTRQINSLIKSLNGDGSIYFPRGVYELDGTVGPIDGVWIVGEGNKKTVFYKKKYRDISIYDPNPEDIDERFKESK